MEESDACGMNLWGEQSRDSCSSAENHKSQDATLALTDLSKGDDWDRDLLAFVAGGRDEAANLERKLGPIEKDGGVVAGSIGRYFVERYGLREGALIMRIIECQHECVR